MIRLIAVAVSAFLSIVSMAAAEEVAPRPPMGWNSWDAYGFTLDEAQYRANIAVLKDLKRFGWTYAVVDEGWYMANPFADRLETRQYRLDDYGRLAPVPTRYPSSADGRGFRSLADWTHAQGLKFGLHIVRGIPKAAVDANTPIEGSAFRAADAADKAALCGWDDANYGVADNAAGQAYYDSLIKLYAAWGLDYLKVDCISDHPYRATEIRQIAEAIRKAGRPIVLSLSPGPTNLTHADEVARHAQMWRISNDLWDDWTSGHDEPMSEAFPAGLRVEFDNLAAWSRLVRPNAWPDADMLPIGSLSPHPGWGDARKSRLTADESRTLVTLWSIARSPMILGANLSELDSRTRALLTNAKVIALNQREGAGRPVAGLPKGLEQARVWVSTPAGARRPDTVAVFNLGEKPLTVKARWKDLGLHPGRIRARDLWDGDRLPQSAKASFVVPPHGVGLYRIDPLNRPAPAGAAALSPLRSEPSLR